MFLISAFFNLVLGTSPMCPLSEINYFETLNLVLGGFWDARIVNYIVSPIESGSDITSQTKLAKVPTKRN